ncbi:MAG: hypothetical protein ACE5JG_04725 [Planctomycetota bacterium]
MIVVWGTRIKRKPLGRVADFCAICRTVRPFRLSRVGATGHLYYVSFGWGRLLGHEIECETCGTRKDADAGAYSSVSKDPGDDAATLTRKTHPGLEQKAAERLALEDRVRSQSLDDEERQDLLREPFYLLEPEVELQRKEQRLSPHRRRLGYLTLALLPALLGLNALRAELGGELVEKALLGGGVLLGIGIAVFVYNKLTHLRVFLRRRIRPRLIGALAPLEPDLEELEATVQHLRDIELVIGRRVKPRRLYDALQTARLNTTEVA